MASSAWLARTVAFFVARLPLANALTLLMLLSERAQRETYPPLNPQIIYGHLLVFVVVGILMGMRWKRKEAALVYIGQLAYLAYVFYTNKKLGYNQWLRVRICIRLLGVSSIYFMFAAKVSKESSSSQFSKFGQTVLGAYLLLSTYLLVNSSEDKTAFIKHVPGGEVALYVYILLLASSAISFFGGMFVYDMIQPVIVMLIISTSFIDSDINYWNRKRGVDFWIQIRLIMDNVSIILGLLFYLLTQKRDVPKSHVE